VSSTTQSPTSAAGAHSARLAPAYLDVTQPRLWRIAGVALAIIPALIITYLAFRTGGYYPETYSSVLVLLAIALGGAAIASRRPFAGLSAPLLVAAGALLLLVTWTWFSSEWSDAPIRALLESQRTSLYLLTLLFFGAFLRRQGALALATSGMATAIVVICAVSLATRFYPDVFSTSTGFEPRRLSFPISYWNSLGLMAGIGLILLVHLASDVRGAAALRVVAAAAIPITALTVYFTFSRGATGAVVVGLTAYLLVGRSRGIVSTVVAAAPATVVALVAAYSADLLGSMRSTTAAAADQGHRVAAWLIAACVGAAILRVALLRLDKRLAEIPPASQAVRRRLLVSAIIAALIAGGAALALDAPSHVKHAYHSFTEGDAPGDARTRLREVSLNGRETHWDVALQYYRADRLKGEGAGTFETQWLRSRANSGETSEAHSLYIEVLGELGLVGFLLILAAIGAILTGLLLRARGHRRPIYSALFAATLMWAVHAGVDWDWELPAVGLGLFALAGVGLARPSAGGGASARVVSSWPFRIAVVIACLLVGVSGVRTVIADAALDDATRELDAGHCRSASEDARVALSAVATHPKPYEVLAYCALNVGHAGAAVKRMRRATELDPDHWRYWYGLGIARAAAGGDPRLALLRARRLNPMAAFFGSGSGTQLLRADRRQWKRLGAAASRPTN
jgi:O-antigen ligase